MKSKYLILLLVLIVSQLVPGVLAVPQASGKVTYRLNPQGRLAGFVVRTKEDKELATEWLRLQEEFTAAKRAGRDVTAIKQSLSYLESRLQREERGGTLDQGGENCADAFDLGSAASVNISGSTSGTANDYAGYASQPACWQDYFDTSSNNSTDVTYRWEVPATGDYTFSLCGSGYDTGLSLWNYTCPAEPGYPDDFICGNDDDPTDACGTRSYIECLPLTAGQILLIVVDGYDTAAGSYTLDISQCAAPCNGSNSTNATVINALPYADSGTTVGQCDDLDLDCGGVGSGAPDVWYSITIDVPSEITIATECNALDLDTEIALLNATLSAEVCDADNAPGCGSGQSLIESYPVAAGDYYIVVDGAGAAEGTYTLTVDTVHSASACDGMTDLGSGLGLVSVGSTTGQTNDFTAQGLGATAPACWEDYYSQSQSCSGEDLLFKWTVPSTAGYSFSLCGSNYDTGLLIYDFTCPALPVNPGDFICGNDDDPTDACGLRSYIECLPLTAGQEILIVVDGWNGADGSYELTITECLPPCDGSNAATATAITGLPYTNAATTVAACDDIATDCGSAGTGPDYWYSLSLDTDVALTVSTTCGGSFDTKIAVLTSGQTQLTCNDDDPSCTSGASLIEDFIVAPGNYFIVVDGAGGIEGNFVINVDTVHSGPPPTSDWLPDIIIREDDLHNHYLQGSGTDRQLRLSNGTANTGLGRLHLYGGQDNGDGTQQVIQTVFRSDGTSYDRVAGNFVFHTTHNHIHFENWCHYRLREVLAGNGVGDVVAEGGKTSFCIIDLAVYNNTLPNFDGSHYNSCGTTIQGLSVGYVDIYSAGLEGQHINIGGGEGWPAVPDGCYWLESEADPHNSVLEANENNNITRILVYIGSGSCEISGINADAYEPNNSKTETEGRTEGIVNSPNLGPTNPALAIPGLNIHASGNEDYFRFYSPATGTAADFVRIDFLNADGDVDMKLLDASGTEVGSSTSTSDAELILLDGLPGGYYTVRVYGYNGATNPDYTLTIDPPANGAPSITCTAPPVGNVTLIHGSETYDAMWNYSDPENNDGWVTVYMNTSPVFDGNEILIPISLNTPAALGVHTINSAYLDFATYYVYTQATDGGTTVGDWSEGTVTFMQAVPDPVNDVTIWPDGNDIVVRWEVPLDGTHHFMVYVRDDPDGGEVHLSDVDSVYEYRHVDALLSASKKFYVVYALPADHQH